MRFMMIYRPADVQSVEAGTPPTQEQMAQMGAFIGQLAKEGVLLATDGLQASSKGARVKQTSGKVTVTDGPFTESKELIAGFAIVQVASKAEAVELAKRSLNSPGMAKAKSGRCMTCPHTRRPIELLV